MAGRQIAQAAVLRGRALEALKTNWRMLLPGYALTMLASYAGGRIAGAVPVIGPFLSMMISALMMVPVLGLTGGVLGYYRGIPVKRECVKRMFPHWQRVCLLYLWTMLCMMGWIMIGAVVTAAGAGLLFGGGAAVVSDSQQGFGVLLMSAGILLMLGLGFRAMLNYSMSQCILIDAPSTGVRETLRKSRAMIAGYRWHYVRVNLPVFAVVLLAAGVVVWLTAALPDWLSSLISAVFSVFSGLLGCCFLPVMYQELRRIGR